MGVVLEVTTDDEGSVVVIPDDVTNVVNTELGSTTVGPSEVVAETIEVLAGTMGPPGADGPAGADGAAGGNSYLVESGGTYPSRTSPSIPVTFYGVTNPDTLGVMLNGDTWVNTSTATPPPHYVTDTELAASTIDGGTYNTPLNRIRSRRGTAAQWNASNPVLQSGEIGTATDVQNMFKVGDGVTAWNSLQTFWASTTSPPTIRDARWNIPSGWTSIDEFDTDSPHVDWVRVDKAAGSSRVDWVQSGGSMMARLNGGDGAAELHALMRPITGSWAVGDALVGHVTITGPAADNFLGVIILANGTTFTGGTQVLARLWINSSGRLNWDIEGFTGYQTESAGGGGGTIISGDEIFIRLVMTAANTWRTDWSQDGQLWITGTATKSMTLTPSHCGLAATTWGGSSKGFIQWHSLRKMTGVL